MPPKKGKNKGEKKEEPVKEVLKSRAAEDELPEETKEYYMIQIRDLEKRLTRYQTKCDKLSIINKDIEEKFSQLVDDRKDIVDFLKKSLEQRQEDVTKLQERMAGQQQDKEMEKESYESQLKEMQSNFHSMKDQLTCEVMVLSAKLASLEEFRIQEETLMQNFEDLEAKLEQQEKEHNETLYNLERKAVVDNYRLKKEMLLRVKSVAEEFRNMSDQQMADTVKRNIRENVVYSIQIAKMTESIKELVQENDNLKRKLKENKIQMEILQTVQDELARKNCSSLKVLKLVVDKAHEQGSLLYELVNKEQEYETVDAHSDELKEENEALKEKMNNVEEEMTNARNLLKKTKTENKELHDLNNRLEDILSSTAHSLKEVLTENCDDDAVDSAAKRQSMIGRLLLVLDSAALLGKAPPPKEFFMQRSKTIMAPLFKAGSERRRSSASSQLVRAYNFPHYKLGDLGLVPRPRPQVFNPRRPKKKSSEAVPLPAAYRYRTECSQKAASIANAKQLVDESANVKQLVDESAKVKLLIDESAK